MQAREGVGAFIEAIGDEAVTIAAMAAAQARVFLQDDNIDFKLVLELATIEKTGNDGIHRQLTNFKFRVYLQDDG